MGMQPDDFFYSFVQGNFDDFRNDPGDIRRAFNAAVSASHFADHYFTYNKRYNKNLLSSFPELKYFIEHLDTQTSGAFKDIRSISNAYKHLYTDKKGSHSNINSSGSIEKISFTQHEDITGLEENLNKIIFTRKDGTKDEIYRKLEITINFFGTLI